MPDTRNISQPSQGSEDLGRDSSTERSTGAPSAGTDTQLHLAAKSKQTKHKDTNDDEKVIKNANGENEFSTDTETDE